MNVEVKPAPAGSALLAEPPAIARVGVIGAGQMGNGIAHVCALAGLPVMHARREGGGAEEGDGDDRPQHGPPGQPQPDLDGRTGRGAGAHHAPAPTTRRSRDADFVIEAATEKEDVKRAIFKLLTPHLKPVLHAGVQHLVDLDHPAGRRRPTGRKSSSACTS